MEEQRVRRARFFRLKTSLYTGHRGQDLLVLLHPFTPASIEQVGTGSNRSRCRTERRSLSERQCFSLLDWFNRRVCVGGPSKAEFVLPTCIQRLALWARSKLALASVQSRSFETVDLVSRHVSERACARRRRTGAFLFFPFFLGERRMWRDSAVCGLTATKGPAVAR